jgi:hypothetical protein
MNDEIEEHTLDALPLVYRGPRHNLDYLKGI